MATLHSLQPDLAALARLANVDLARLRHMSRDQSERALAALITEYGEAAATLAADWYDDLRDEARVGVQFAAIAARIEDSGVGALLGWAHATALDEAAFWGLVAGGTQRRISDYARQSVMESSAADPMSVGWQRVASGGCGFCLMLASRGAVYSESSADFASHDHCNCVAVPVFEGRALPVRRYVPTDRQISDTDRARTRDWIRDNL